MLHVQTAVLGFGEGDQRGRLALFALGLLQLLSRFKSLVVRAWRSRKTTHTEAQPFIICAALESYSVCPFPGFYL